MKKAMSIAVCMAVSVSVFAKSSAFADEPVFSGEKETYIVLTETEKDGKKIQSQFDGEILLGDEAVSCELTEHQAEKLEQRSGVIAVSEDIILEGSGRKSKKKLYAEQWNLEAIGAEDNKLKSSGVKIEVLDSGVSYTDDLNIMAEVNLVPGEEEVSPMFVDANGHGTGIAGLIGAKDNKDGIKGVFPDAEIYSVKAFDENLKSPLSRIVEGVYWGIENDMDIINMSFGTTVNSAVLHQAIKDAEAAGILLIAAAGNTEHQDINYPAAYDEVIAVGSINAEGELAELTSTGTELELLAPGEQVCTTGLFYGTIGVSGTSIATAQVTGAAAMLKSKDKTKSNDFIRGLLKTSSKEVEGTNAGLIDCEYALEIYDEYAKNYTKGEKAVEKLENNEAVPDYSTQADIVVEGLWSGKKHETTIREGNKLSEKTISESNIRLMAKTAKEADTVFGSKVKNQEYNLKNLHGKNNYVASLKFLWLFAKNLGNKQTTSNAKSKALNSLPKDLQNDKMKNMANKLATYINNNTNAKEYSKKKYLIMGFACHLIGDTYAHRAIVPKKTVASVGNNKTNSKFGKSHFKSNTSAEFTNSNLKACAKNPNDKVKKSEKYRCWQAFSKTVNLGVMEFIDIKFYMKENINLPSTIYEDDPAFCKYRYDDSILAINGFFDVFSGSFDELILYPAYGTVLNHYYGYIQDTGIKTTHTTKKEWAKISTMDSNPV